MVAQKWNKEITRRLNPTVWAFSGLSASLEPLERPSSTGSTARCQEPGALLLGGGCEERPGDSHHSPGPLCCGSSHPGLPAMCLTCVLLQVLEFSYENRKQPKSWLLLLHSKRNWWRGALAKEESSVPVSSGRTCCARVHFLQDILERETPENKGGAGAGAGA